MNCLAGWLKRPYEYFVFYGGLVLFAALCLGWSLIATVLYFVLPARLGAKVGQFGIMATFRIYLFVLRATGIVECDLSALDALRGRGAMIIAPNHPALIDVVLIASRIPNIVGIMKAQIWHNILFGGGAQLARYIRNDSARGVIRLSIGAAKRGGSLLIFPEGTRTVGPRLHKFKPGFALIAKKARVPVQTVFIATNSAFLGKHWPLFKLPQFPLRYQVQLGEQFYVEGEVNAFVAQLETYFESEMHKRGIAALPDTPSAASTK